MPETCPTCGHVISDARRMTPDEIMERYRQWRQKNDEMIQQLPADIFRELTGDRPPWRLNGENHA